LSKVGVGAWVGVGVESGVAAGLNAQEGRETTQPRILKQQRTRVCVDFFMGFLLLTLIFESGGN
jgi:hypothetical protein